LSKLIPKIGCIIIIVAFVSCKKDTNLDRIYLFNNFDLTGWDTWLGIPDSTQDVPGLAKDGAIYTESFGLNTDPLKIFDVVEVDGGKAIRIDGYVWGALITQEEYENYHLHAEFKWGQAKHPPREFLDRNSGICYHSVGEYGLFWTYWMRSCELEIKEGGALGDFFRVDNIMAKIPVNIDPELTFPPYRYDETGDSATVYGDMYMVHASKNMEKPFGEWNSIDLYTFNNNSVHIINEEIVMKAYNIKQISKTNELIPLKSGKIQIQSEGAEVFFRNIWIEPISELPGNK